MMTLAKRPGEARAPAAEPAPESRDDEARSSWGLNEGDEVAPGRSVVRHLGGGERYEAFLAWDDQLLSLVVAKVLRPALVDDPASRAALEAEAAVLRHLSHPVIVRVFDAAPEAERPHLVLEYVDGPRLSTLIRTYETTLDQTLSLGIQLAAAAHYMSTRDIVHLDIKPQNIIMAGPARLIDLSLARRTDQLPAISSAIGTPKYMAPEQFDPSRFHELGPATDVWGIGATLYWMLAKRSPFPAPVSDSAVLEERYPQLVHEPAPLPDSVPPDLVELVDTMLAREPAERPSAREVLEALEPMMAALPRPRLGRFRVKRKTHRQL